MLKIIIIHGLIAGFVILLGLGVQYYADEGIRSRDRLVEKLLGPYTPPAESNKSMEANAVREANADLRETRKDLVEAYGKVRTWGVYAVWAGGIYAFVSFILIRNPQILLDIKASAAKESAKRGGNKKTYEELLLLKKLFDERILSQEDFDKKSDELKEKIT